MSVPTFQIQSPRLELSSPGEVATDTINSNQLPPPSDRAATAWENDCRQFFPQIPASFDSVPPPPPYNARTFPENQCDHAADPFAVLEIDREHEFQPRGREEEVEEGDTTSPSELETTTEKDEECMDVKGEVFWVDWLCTVKGDDDVEKLCCCEYSSKTNWPFVHAIFLSVSVFGIFAVGIFPILTVTVFSPPFYRRSSPKSLHLGPNLEVGLGSHLFQQSDLVDGAEWLYLRDCRGRAPEKKTCRSSSGRSSSSGCTRDPDFEQCDYVNTSINPFRSCPEIQNHVRAFASWHFSGGTFMLLQPVLLGTTLISFLCCCSASKARFLSYGILLPLDLLVGTVIVIGDITSILKIGTTPCARWEQYAPGNGPTLLSIGNAMEWSHELIMLMVSASVVGGAIFLGTIFLTIHSFYHIFKKRQFS